MVAHPITIENGRVTIRPTANGVGLRKVKSPTCSVYLPLLLVPISAQSSKAAFWMKTVFPAVPARTGTLIERYDLEMITVLAFRLKSEKAEVFRKWIVERATTPEIVWKIPAVNDEVLN